MIGLLLKNRKWILDIILVIALVILLFIWNPFGIFGGGIKLQPTANLVTEIKEMGQLVTSEYYGEVIASIEESKVNFLEEEAIAEKAGLLYDRLYEAMDDLIEFQRQPIDVKEASFTAGSSRERNKIIRADVNRRNIVDKLNHQGLLEDLSFEPLYADILEFIWTNATGNNNWKGSSRQKEEALMLIYTRAGNSKDEDFQEQGFTQFYYGKRLNELPKKESKKKLAMVGRGWVKAGFDFSTLNNSNFYINEDAGEVHFFGLSATILNSDINPWFIPEKGIPGFEILDYNGRVNFKDARQLKLYCIDKLVLKAHDADILKNAEIHGAEVLRNIFSLLTQKEIKKVFFHHDNIIRFSRIIAEDEYISYYEAVMLDSVIKKENHIIDSLLSTRENSFRNNQLARHREENIHQVVGAVYYLPFEDVPGNFSKYSRIAYEMAQDSVLDEDEMENIATLRTSFSEIEASDSLANPEDGLLHAADFNNLLTYLIHKGVKTGSSSDTILSKSDFSNDFLSSHHVLDYEPVNESQVRTTLFTPDATNDQLYKLLYPYHIDSESWKQIISNEKLILDSLPIHGLDSSSFVKQHTVIYAERPSPHLKIFDLKPTQLLEPLLLKKYSDKKWLWVSDDLCIILSPLSAESIDTARTLVLSPTQSQEMEQFYNRLVSYDTEQKKKGPVVRANQWVQNKFENNTSLPEWFSKLKTKLSDYRD